MNYWIQTTEFPPFHGGGISTYCHHTAKMLLSKGHHVLIIVPDRQVNGDQLLIEKGRLTTVRFNPEVGERYRSLGYTAGLSWRFSEVTIMLLANKEISKPDYIEMQEYLGVGYYTLLKKKMGEPDLAGIPIVITAHAPSFFYLRSNQSPTHALPDYWTGIMEKWTLKAADIKISPSEYLKTSIAADLGEMDSELIVARNPFEFEKDAKIPIGEFNKGEIVFLGKLTYQKGCQHLISYLDRAWEQGFKGWLRVIGDDHHFAPRASGMREYLEKRYKRHIEANRLQFEGKIPPELIYERLLSAHIVVVPSVVDNLPYTVIEAMTKAKVVLISDSGGHVELIEHGVDGFVYKQGSEESFLSVLEQIMELTTEEVLSIGKKAQQKVKRMCGYDEVFRKKMEILCAYKEQDEGDRIFPFAADIPSTAAMSQPAGNRRLSIIVPYYNMGKYVEETIQCIYSTSYEPKEVIVVNDGSTDPESITKIFRLQEQYGFKLITQRNAGLASARNTGARNARGEFIAFLDPDDKIDLNFYSKAIALLCQYSNVSFVSSWVEYFQDSTGIWPAQIPEPPFLLIHNMVCAGIVSRRFDFLKFGLNDPSFEYGMEDYDSIVSMVLKGRRGIVIPEPSYKYRIHQSSMARGFNKFNQLYLYSLLVDKHKEAYREFAPDIFKLLLANGPGYLYDNPTVEPHTDVKAMQDWIEELEKANRWYSDTLNYLKENSNSPSIAGLEMPQPTLPLLNGTIDNQAKQIQNWYDKEYEVLPSWYKRIGHIIKVAQGHRSLKSLFKK